MTWQQTARIGVVLVAALCALAIFTTLGTREVPERPSPLIRVDPTAVIETTGANLQQLRGIRRDYRIEAERQLTYEDGTTRFLSARVLVEDRQGRDFLMTGGEAYVGASARELEMTGGVTLSATDGFVLSTNLAVFNDDTGIVRAPGPVSFSRGGMTGTGVGMAYDTGLDILTIDADTVVTITSTDGDRLEFASHSAFFDRIRHTLVLDRVVRVLRGGEVLQAENAYVELDELGEHATFIALRDNARVDSATGGALDSMRAMSIDLNYSDDGLFLERAGLNGNSELFLIARPGEITGRSLRADGIQLTLSKNQVVSSLDAAGSTAFWLPAITGPNRTVMADGMQSEGDETGLRSASFVGTVVFHEEHDQDIQRFATADRLLIEFDEDVVQRAVFTDGARFESGTLSATGLEAHYVPQEGSLSLRGLVGGSLPRIDDGRLAVEATVIDVLIDDMTIAAAGGVQTTMAGGPTSLDGALLPALLDRELIVNISSEVFSYGGTQGRVTYTGTAVLWQNDTTIRADSLTLDQANGDLIADGNVQSTLIFDGEASLGTASTIRYDETERMLQYGQPVAPLIGEGQNSTFARLAGPQGDLAAETILVRLAADAEVETIEATSDVHLLLGTRAATGNMLSYNAADGLYALRGLVGTPAVLIDGCRRTEGRSLMFLVDGDQVVVDGDQEVRTRTADNPCQETVQP